jgi:hypothetical protein
LIVLRNCCSKFLTRCPKEFLKMPLKGNSVNDGDKGGIRQSFFVFYKTSIKEPR